MSSETPQLPDYDQFSKADRKSPPLKGLRHFGQFLIVWVFLRLAMLLPVRLAQKTGSLLGALLFPLIRRDRTIIEHQISRVFPEMTEKERTRFAKTCYRNMGVSLFEVLLIPRIRKKATDWIQFQNETALREAYQEGKGVILVTGHMANWELFSIVFEMLRIPARAIVRSIFNQQLNNLLLNHRKSDFLQAIQRGSKDSPRQLLNCLRNGDVLVVALDQDTDVPGVFVDFFGLKANTPRIAANLALKMGVPLMTGFDQRLEDGRHCFHFNRLPLEEGIENNEENQILLTQRLSDAMEAHIRKFPEQWAWNHRRWKRRPPDETASPA